MSERDECGDVITIFAKAVPFPAGWLVTCPTCGDELDCPMVEMIVDGSYVPGDEEGCPYVQCACGTIIEPSGVMARAISSPETDNT